MTAIRTITLVCDVPGCAATFNSQRTTVKETRDDAMAWLPATTCDKTGRVQVLDRCRDHVAWSPTCEPKGTP